MEKQNRKTAELPSGGQLVNCSSHITHSPALWLPWDSGPSWMICLAATAEERWMGSIKMLSVSASETTEYL